MLYLKLFGGFRLRGDDGRRIEIELAKQRALLAYLALNPRREIDRSQLASLLWGSQPETRARHSLTQALSSLARALGDSADGLLRGRRQVSLQPETIAVDAAGLLRIDETSKPEELLGAIEAFEQDVLIEFSFNESAFSEWVLLTRETLQEHALRAGVAYLSLDESLRDTNASLSVARKLLRIDPYFEPAHRALIREYLACGDPPAAKNRRGSASRFYAMSSASNPDPKPDASSAPFRLAGQPISPMGPQATHRLQTPCPAPRRSSFSPCKT